MVFYRIIDGFDTSCRIISEITCVFFLPANPKILTASRESLSVTGPHLNKGMVPARPSRYNVRVNCGIAKKKVSHSDFYCFNINSVCWGLTERKKNCKITFRELTETL